jgi:hypothetical protein
VACPHAELARVAMCGGQVHTQTIANCTDRARKQGRTRFHRESKEVRSEKCVRDGIPCRCILSSLPLMVAAAAVPLWWWWR